MKHRKPIIGLTSSFMTHEERDLVFLPDTYFKAIRHFGGIPLLIPVHAEKEELTYLLDQCDGIILTGGDDIVHQCPGGKVGQGSRTQNRNHDYQGHHCEQFLLVHRLFLLFQII